jgi:hypothetical protein
LQCNLALIYHRCIRMVRKDPTLLHTLALACMAIEAAQVREPTLLNIAFHFSTTDGTKPALMLLH